MTLMADTLAIAVTSTYFAIGAVHLYWAAGGTWPGHDAESLVRTVVGGGPGLRFPGALACGGVAVALALAGGIVLANRGFFEPPVPGSLLRIGVYGISAILMVRGIGGFFEERMRPQIVGTRYQRLNRSFYSPLCLVLGTATVLTELVR